MSFRLSVCPVTCFFFVQAGILAVGRGNQVVEPIVGTDGILSPYALLPSKLTLL